MNIMFNTSNHIKIVLIFILALLMLFVTLLVYMTGGVQYAYPHMMYLPIIIAGIIFGIPGGIISGIVGGLLLGPVMPVNVEQLLMQDTINWLTRLIFFTFIGCSTGFLVLKLKNYFYARINALSHLANSNIPLLSQLYLHFEHKDRGTKEQTAIIYINILNYNKLNDYLGHIQYNDALIKTAYMIKAMLPNASTLYAKDAQSLLICLDDQNVLSQTLETIETELMRSISIHDVPIHLETAIGAAVFNDTLDQTIRNAVKAARYAERHFYPSTVYHPECEEQNNDIVYLGAVLDGLKDNDFYLVYQPQYNAKNKTITSLEVLLRWHHKIKGDVPPNVFIPIIEQTTLINPLTDWVVKEALKTIKKLNELNIDIPIAINISTKNLFHKRFFESIVDQLHAHDIKPHQIELEITESALMHNPDVTEDVLKKFRDYGISISLDDFGTGYSSLSYLKKFDVQKIKIDRAFITGLSDDTYSQTIVKTAVQLANAYDITTVAEGVETTAQYNILNDIGCTYIQGFLFSKPLPLKHIIPLLNAS
ncbi:MAG: EAL domain-containing protein [Bacillota bacterium]